MENNEITDWQGSRNTLRQAMEESVENALGISTFTLNVLHANQGNPDPGFGVLFTEHDQKQKKLLEALGLKDSSLSSQTANTKNVELAYKDMAEKLTHFDDLVRPVFGKNTFEYNSIWGLNRNRFYRGSYEQREMAVKGLADSMHAYPALAAVEAEVTDYFNYLVNARQSQQGVIGGKKTFGAEVFTAIEALILQQDRNLGWLKFHFAFDENPRAKVNAFFDLSKIINHAHNKIYPCHLPIDGNVKVCRRGFKETDRIKITIDGSEDAYFFLVPNSEWSLDPAKGFRGTAGTIIEKPVKEIFPDLTYNQVMALNSSTTKPSHFVFEIIEA